VSSARVQYEGSTTSAVRGGILGQDASTDDMTARSAVRGKSITLAFASCIMSSEARMAGTSNSN
jgi:hypothetical protein